MSYIETNIPTYILIVILLIVALFVVQKMQRSSKEIVSVGYIENWKAILQEELDFGDNQANVGLIIFYDYECPFCSSFDQELEKVIARFDDQINGRFVHRLLAGHENAYDAALASECAKVQGSFFPYHERLFENSMNLYDVNYIELAREIGVSDIGKFQKCYQDGETFLPITLDMSLADSLGIMEVPSFAINGKLYKGNISSKMIEKLIIENQ